MRDGRLRGRGGLGRGGKNLESNKAGPGRPVAVGRGVSSRDDHEEEEVL